MREDLTAAIIAYRDTVFRVALGYVKNIHDADDIAQNVFMKLAARTERKAFPSEEAQKAWLIRVTINESKNLLGSAWRKNRSDLDADESLAQPQAPDYSGIRDYVRQLPPKYRTVIYLHYFEGYSTKEIAAILKMTQTAVTTRLNRARQQLKEDIIKEDNFYELQGLI
jgi:RNA polymerase sigma-70 factor (ECF subfamily)